MGSVLRNFLKEYHLEEGIRAQEVEGAWREIMGEPIARYTRKTTYREGVLYVELESDALRHELQFGLSRILSSFQERFGEETLREVRLL